MVRLAGCPLLSARPDQLAVINASLSGHDVLLIMPTGHISSNTEPVCFFTGSYKKVGVQLILTNFLQHPILLTRKITLIF